MKFSAAIVFSLAAVATAAPLAQQANNGVVVRREKRQLGGVIPTSGAGAGAALGGLLNGLVGAFAAGENAIQAAAEAFINGGSSAFAGAAKEFDDFIRTFQAAAEAAGLAGEQVLLKGLSDFVNDANAVGEAIETQGFQQFQFGIQQLKEGAQTLETALQTGALQGGLIFLTGLNDLIARIQQAQDSIAAAGAAAGN